MSDFSGYTFNAVNADSSGRSAGCYYNDETNVFRFNDNFDGVNDETFNIGAVCYTVATVTAYESDHGSTCPDWDLITTFEDCKSAVYELGSDYTW